MMTVITNDKWLVCGFTVKTSQLKKNEFNVSDIMMEQQKSDIV